MPSVLELALEGDAVGVSELFWGGVLKAELAITLVVREADDVRAVDEVELELELELEEL